MCLTWTSILSPLDDFGGWKKAQETHFSDGGIFDQIYEGQTAEDIVGHNNTKKLQNSEKTESAASFYVNIMNHKGSGMASFGQGTSVHYTDPVYDIQISVNTFPSIHQRRPWSTG